MDRVPDFDPNDYSIQEFLELLETSFRAQEIKAELRIDWAKVALRKLGPGVFTGKTFADWDAFRTFVLGIATPADDLDSLQLQLDSLVCRDNDFQKLFLEVTRLSPRAFAGHTPATRVHGEIKAFIRALPLPLRTHVNMHPYNSLGAVRDAAFRISRALQDASLPISPPRINAVSDVDVGQPRGRQGSGLSQDRSVEVTTPLPLPLPHSFTQSPTPDLSADDIVERAVRAMEFRQKVQAEANAKKEAEEAEKQKMAHVLLALESLGQQVTRLQSQVRNPGPNPGPPSMGATQGKSPVQCWSCQGFGHVQRVCPNRSAKAGGNLSNPSLNG